MKNEYIPKTLKKTVFTNNPKIGYEINFSGPASSRSQSAYSWLVEDP